MHRIFFVLLAGVIVVAAAWQLAGLPGHVAAQIGTISVDTSTPIAVLALLLLFLLVYLAVRLLALLLGLPRIASIWQTARRRKSGDAAVTKALVALAAGERADARREASRARRLLGDTPQTLLLAAEAGRIAGREDEAATAFRALTAQPEAAFLGFRGLLRQAMAREDWTEAASLARRAEAAHPGAAWLRHERAQLAIRAGHWAEAMELAEPDAPKAALAAAAADAEPDPSRALRLARQAWKQDPAFAPAALAYAKRLRAEGRESRAQAVLAKTWQLAPHPDVAAFALAPVTDALARAQAAKRLTAQNPEHVESRILLARSALAAGLTGEARRQAEAAVAAGANQRRVWLLLAETEEEERGDTEAGRMAQRDALRHAASADPDPGWQCQVCHAPSADWHPACPICASAGSLRWDSGVRTTSLPAVI
ncbi:MAG TPA: heme biosynthesis HemY N-terminal domain-containing protein [Acetobacteraceae bacterium]|nr:heme biosynthesis HemY N-terminal domain-containing protein [Acetobacteraceae bacterium]